MKNLFRTLVLAGASLAATAPVALADHDRPRDRRAPAHRDHDRGADHRCTDACYVVVAPGHYETQTRQVAVPGEWVYENRTVTDPGRWETYNRQVTVPGRWETVYENVTVPGHWKTVQNRVLVPGGMVANRRGVSYRAPRWEVRNQNVWVPPCTTRQAVRKWIAPCTQTVAERRWCPPQTRTERVRVWKPACTQTVTQRVWVPARRELRCAQTPRRPRHPVYRINGAVSAPAPVHASTCGS